jgi:hypothetical protein
VPVAALQDATPTRPPKSAVPKADEESFRPRTDELPVPEADAEPPTPPESAADPAPLPLEQPTKIPETAPSPEPTPSPPAKRSAADDNLFDESATGPVPRRFVASRPAKAAAERPARPSVRPTTLTYPASVERFPKSGAGNPLAVPRVPFDQAAEAARLGR